MHPSQRRLLAEDPRDVQLPHVGQPRLNPQRQGGVDVAAHVGAREGQKGGALVVLVVDLDGRAGDEDGGAVAVVGRAFVSEVYLG